MVSPVPADSRAADGPVLDEAQTVADLVVARADDAHTAIVSEHGSCTWSELVEAAGRRAALLTSLRVDGPFNVGVLLDNSPEYIELLCGAALSGATLVCLNSTRRGDELAADINHTDCQLLVTDGAHAALLDGLDTSLSNDRVLLCDSTAYAAALDSVAPAASSPVAPDDLYLLIFTSGSSGAPKAVRMTHGRAVRAADSLLCGRDDVPYCAMPLFHGNALNACFFPALGVGATIALRRRFSASAFLDDVRRHGCTYFSSIGRVLNYVLATPERHDDADNPLKLVLAPEASATDMADFERRFGCPVLAGYGSSENAVILLPAPRSAAGALGVAPQGEDIAVVDPDTGQECPPAEFDSNGRLLNAEQATGELVGRNALGRFEGYWNNPDASTERSRDGWYWSGDLAYRDRDGVFWFAGRTSDWIRVDGENFPTAPVERILEQFHGVRTAVVYGVPDVRNAEDQVMAALQLHDPAQFDPGEFRTFLAGRADMGTKWAPGFVRVAADLPVTGTNKVDKRAMRSAAWCTSDPVWWRPDRRAETYVELVDADVEGLLEQLRSNRPGVELQPEP